MTTSVSRRSIGLAESRHRRSASSPRAASSTVYPAISRISRAGARMLTREGLVEIDVARLDREPPASRHRVARVDREVHEYLLELGRVGLDPVALSVRGGCQGDVLSDQALEHRDRLADRGVEMQDARLEHLLSAERQELLGERGGSMRRPLDQIEVLARLRTPLEALQEDFAATMDDRQEVVEVVGHAAGETADRVHLLGLQERLLSRRHLFGGHLALAEEPRVFQGGCACDANAVAILSSSFEKPAGRRVRIDSTPVTRSPTLMGTPRN